MKTASVSRLLVPWMIVALCGVVSVSAAEIRFDRDRYDIAPGETFTAQLLISPPPTAGLSSFGVKLRFDAARVGVAGTGAISVPGPLDFNGVAGTGAVRLATTDCAAAKGTVEFSPSAPAPYGGSVLAAFSLTDRATAGGYLLRSDFFNTLGPTEEIFVDGLGNVLDPQLIFRTALVNYRPLVRIIRPTQDASFAQPSHVLIEAEASDVDGSVTNVCFFAGTNKLGFATSSPWIVSWTNPPPGVHLLRAVATDNHGATAVSPDVRITICSLAAVGPAHGLVCQGLTSDLMTVASGLGPFSYQWFRDGLLLRDATNALLTVGEPGRYCVRVQGACGVLTNCADVSFAAIHVIVQARPPEGGTTSGDAFATNRQPATVSATPNDGFTFLHWQEANSILTTNRSYSFSATANRTLVANFARARGEYVGWWKLDDAAGAVARDSSGNAHLALLTNGLAFIPNGRRHGALAFDGIDDWGSVPHADALEFANRQFTAAVWVRTTKQGPQALIEKEHSTFANFILAINRDGLESTRGAFSVWTGNRWVDSNFRNVTDGQWHHLAVSFDGTAFRLYRDGLEDKVEHVHSAYVGTGLPLHFGRLITARQGWPFAGTLDEIILASRAFSQSEIAELATDSSRTTLTVASENPDTGVNIDLTPNDSHNQGTGFALFNRSYVAGTSVTLTAPAIVLGNTFQKWRLDGHDFETNRSASVLMDSNHTVTAVYMTPPPLRRTLIVDAINAPSPVPVTIQPADAHGLGSGSTPLVRAYSNHTMVRVEAPAHAHGNPFVRWQQDGVDGTTDASVLLTLEADHRMTAVYAADTDLVGWWKFDNVTESFALDSSGFGQHGFLLNSPRFTNGVCNVALDFDGFDDAVRVADSERLDFNRRSFTVSLFVNTSHREPQALIEKEHSAFVGMFLLALNRDGIVPGAFSVWTGSAWIDSEFRGVTDGTWHHLAVTYDGARFALFHDGLPDRSVLAGANYANTGRPLNFGRSATGAGWPFHGRMDDVRRYRRGLSVSEVARLALCPTALPPPPFTGPESPRFLSIHLDADGKVQLRFLGQASRPYLLQTSTNLSEWTELHGISANEAGEFEFIDRQGGTDPCRFYRVTTLP